MQAFTLPRDLNGNDMVSRKFWHLKRGSVVVSERISRKEHWVSCVQDGVCNVWPAVPVNAYLQLLNRMHEGGVIADVIYASWRKSKLTPFIADKAGIFQKYISTATYPSYGVVSDSSGRERECYILGKPEVGTSGRMQLLLDQSIIFVPEI